MKIALSTNTYFGQALLGLLMDCDYDMAPKVDRVDGDWPFILVNTDKRTYKDSDTDGGRTVMNPVSQWAEIVAAIKNTSTAPVAVQPAPVPSFTYRVGDVVTMSNTASTAPKFKLQANFAYTVDRVKANGKGQEVIGFAGLPNDEYLASRATKVASRVSGVDAVQNGVTGSVAAAASAVDAAGNTLAVGDTVLIKTPNAGRRDGKFNLQPNKVDVISRVTAKGAIGFAGTSDEYLAKRFQKVTLSPAKDEDGELNVISGDLVVATPRRDGRFALPGNTVLTFRGVTVEGGSFILDGYTTDQYAGKRFQKVTLVG